MTHETIGTMLVGLIAAGFIFFSIIFYPVQAILFWCAVALWVNRKGISAWLEQYK
jgi:hypothetical protein